jgi:hypothetical protein
MGSKTAIYRRIAPSVPLSLTFKDETGEKTLHFRLAFDFNTAAAIEDKTGKNILRGELLEDLTAKNLSAAFWAMLLLNHPEYDSDEGLLAVRTYVTIANSGEIANAVKRAFILTLAEETQKAIREAEAALAAGGEVPPANAPAATS